jgi:hypothetical protein
VRENIEMTVNDWKLVTSIIGSSVVFLGDGPGELQLLGSSVGIAGDG